MSFIAVSVLLSVPLFVLPVDTHSLITVDTFISVLLTVLLRVTFVIVHIVPISVAVTAAVPASPHVCAGVLVKTRNDGLCSEEKTFN